MNAGAGVVNFIWYFARTRRGAFLRYDIVLLKLHIQIFKIIFVNFPFQWIIHNILPDFV